MDELQRATIKKTIFWVLQSAKSKTVWFNVITFGLLVFEAYYQIYPIDPKHIAFINAIGNLVLRYLTNKSISEK